MRLLPGVGYFQQGVILKRRRAQRDTERQTIIAESRWDGDCT